MRPAILDTNVYIDHWERRLDSASFAELRRKYVIRQSAVVLSELVRGARTRQAEGMVESLRRMCRVIWEPNAMDWWTAGQLIRKIGDAHDWDISKRRGFQNDVLIALTARRYGATLVTSNRRDFELLRAELAIDLFVL
ncbi:MAG TPA: PIN domain-containing protein [Polyangium sp.]|nr:PIN domain-containing protein [Polyangium sp.]